MFFAWNTESYLQKVITDGLITGAQTSANLLSRQYAKPLFQGEIALIDEQARLVAQEKAVLYIVVKDSDGQVLIRESNAAGAAKTAEKVFNSFFVADENAYEVNAPIIYENNLLGQVQLGFSPKSTFDLVALGRGQAITIALSVMGLSFLTSWLVVKAITRPLINLTDIAEKIAGGDLSQRIEATSKDEVGQLSKAFQNMVVKLEESYSTLKEEVQKRTKELSDRTKELSGRTKELEVLFDGITDSISVQDITYNVITANSSAVLSCGKSDVEELVGRKCYDLYMQRNAPCENCPLDITIHTGKPAFSEQERGKNVFHLYSYPITDEQGQLREIILFKKDLTRIRALEKQVIQSAKLAELGELAAMVAHEIRNPLGGIN